MEPQPLRSFPPDDSGECGSGGGGDVIAKKVEEEWMVVMEGKKNTAKEESPSIKFDIGNSEQSFLNKKGNSVLTTAQFFEFQQQALIFEHMKAGLPVPLHLWSPIWKKVASSDHGGIYKQYPSFVRFSPQNVDDRKKCGRTDDGIHRKVDYRYMIDPEPGRCRRTDGNKWRCKKNAVPDQKYCERHMHRGSQRSRKHVESSQIANPCDTTSHKDSERLKPISMHSQNDPHPQSPLPLTFSPLSNLKKMKTSPTLSQLINSPSNNTSNIPPTATATATAISTTTTTTNSKDENKNDFIFLGEGNSTNAVKVWINSAIAVDAASNATLTDINSTPIIPNTITNDSNNDSSDCVNCAASQIPSSNCMTLSISGSDPSLIAANLHSTNVSNKINEHIAWKSKGGSSTSVNNMIVRSSKSGNNAIGSSVSTGFGFSPKSVLQVLGCRGSSFYRSDVELDLGRCRRTDGKKWRCRGLVVPYQKYCEKHMHRGSKKRLEVSHPVANFATVGAGTCTRCTISKSNIADSVTTRTNLSISIPRSPQFLTNDAKSPTSFSSDATISDTAITANENSNLSS